MRFILGLLLASISLSTSAAEAQLPKVHGAPQTRGRVMDAERGTPLQGAVVVLRWEWLQYYAGGWHSSPSFENQGEVLHLAETATDAEGRYSAPAWGPVVRERGKVEPRVLVFKPGYEPANRAFEPGAASAIRLAKPTAAPKEYAKSIGAFQRDGLKWLYARDDWKGMPRMILALHREKGRLAEDGARILGAHRLQGRSGKGELNLPGFESRIVRRVAGSPPSLPVVAITWRLRSDDGRPGRRFVQQGRVGLSESMTRFYISPWRYPQPGGPGWSAALDEPPLVRVYAPGYRALPDRAWTEAGASLAMQPLAETKEAALGELRGWRSDIEAELAKGDPSEALAAQQPLIRLLVQECARLTLDARAGICFDPASTIALSARAPGAGEGLLAQSEYGIDELEPYPASKATSSIQGISAVPAKESGPKKRVDGFVIAPAENEPRAAPR